MRHVVDLPTSVMLGNKRFSLNLNVYRNAHHHILSKAKTTFEKEVSPLLAELPYTEKLAISYRLFVPTKRRTDLSNVCSVVDKFFCDVLTARKIIPDDDMSVLSSISYGFGGIDKDNPRVEAVLEMGEP